MLLPRHSGDIGDLRACFPETRAHRGTGGFLSAGALAYHTNRA